MKKEPRIPDSLACDAGEASGRVPAFRGRALRRAGGIFGTMITLLLMGCSAEDGTRTREQDALGTNLSSTVLSLASSPVDFEATLPVYVDASSGPGFKDDMYTVSVRMTGVTAAPDLLTPNTIALGVEDPANPGTYFNFPNVDFFESKQTSRDVVTFNISLDPAASPGVPMNLLANLAGMQRNFRLTLINSPGGDVITLGQIVIAPLRRTNVGDPATEELSFPSSSGPTSPANYCGGCHTNQYNQWRSSMMGYSSISPPIHALELTENHVSDINPYRTVPMSGRLERDVATPFNEAHAQGGTSLLCQRCHAPSAVFTDTFRVFNLDGLYTDSNRGQIPDSHTLLRLIIGADELTGAATGLLRTEDWDDGGPAPDTIFKLAPNEVQDKIEADALAGTEGVTCTVCHSINGIDEDDTGGRMGFEPGIANTAFRIVHNGPGETRINFGPYPDDEVDPLHPAGHMQYQDSKMLLGTDGISRPFIQTGQLCGTCHDVRIPQADPGTGEDFQRVENLFTEWRDSVWNNNNSSSSNNNHTFENPRGLSGAVDSSGTPLGNLKTSTTCQDCHMSEFPIRAEAGPGKYAPGKIVDSSSYPTRDKISNHRFIGVDRFLTHDQPRYNEFYDGTWADDELKNYDVSIATSSLVGAGNDLSHLALGSEEVDLRQIMLSKAAELKIENVGQVSGDMLPISVSVENVGVGHNLPAGLSQERQVWIELEVLDANGSHVYTSGYLTPLPGLDDPDAQEFQPGGSVRYKDSFCAEVDTATGISNEYECELDFFRVPSGAEIGPDLNLVTPTPGVLGTFVPGMDVQLTNYQNGFALGNYDPNNPLQDKVLTQFIGDHIINTNALAPFEKRTEEYMIPVAKVPSQIRNGPYTVNARLRFRPLPAEFLEGLQKAFGGDPTTADPTDYPFPSRISKDVIKKNKVIEMEQDACVAGGFTTSSLRACGRADGSLTTVAAGQGHTCVSWGDELALTPGTFDGIDNRGDYVRYTQCFGDDQFGQVGAGVRLGGGSDERTAVTVDLINQATLSAGNAHTCALHRGGTVSCWGAGGFGRLGDNNTSPHRITGPQEIDSSVLKDVSTIASADTSTCAVTKGQSPDEDGISCWGLGEPGELGTGSTPPAVQVRGLPTGIAPLASGEPLRGIEQLAAGAHHYCAIADGRKLGGANGITPLNDALGNPAYTSGHVYCWGSGPGTGQLATAVSRPTRVAVPYQATQVVAGENFSCALTTTGEVYCWGSNDNGRLGIGDSTVPMSTTPLKVALVEDRTYNLTAGRNHACLAAQFENSPTSAGVYCWGDGQNGKLGDEASVDRYEPTLTHFGTIGYGFTGIVAMAAGDEHTCVVSDGSALNFAEPGLYCWGDNSNGQLGMDDVTSGIDKPTKLEFYDKNDPDDPTDDVEGDLPDPMITGRSYYATESRGGPGESGCILANFPFVPCEDKEDLVDVNGGDNFRYYVDAFGGMTELHFEVSMASGSRSMEVFLNGSPTGMILSATVGTAPRNGTEPDRYGVELPPVTLNLWPGINEIVLQDNQGTDEFDMHRVRLVRIQDGNCFDGDTNNGETDVDCGGPFCEGCDVGQICGQDVDCASFDCEANMCQEPEDPVGGPCDLSTAIDMGTHGASTFTTSNACLKLTQYPVWWAPRPVKIRRDGGTVDMSFTWDNRGAGCAPNAFGSGMYSSGVDEVIIGDGVDEQTSTPLNESTVSGACPTLIKLNGDGTPVQIRWWGN